MNTYLTNPLLVFPELIELELERKVLARKDHRNNDRKLSDRQLFGDKQAMEIWMKETGLLISILILFLNGMQKEECLSRKSFPYVRLVL